MTIDWPSEPKQLSFFAKERASISSVEASSEGKYLAVASAGKLELYDL